MPKKAKTANVAQKTKKGELIKIFRKTKFAIVSKKSEIGQKVQKCLNR